MPTPRIPKVQKNNSEHSLLALQVTNKELKNGSAW